MSMREYVQEGCVNLGNVKEETVQRRKEREDGIGEGCEKRKGWGNVKKEEKLYKNERGKGEDEEKENN